MTIQQHRLKADVAIIGGGTAGCSAALHLRQRGVAVILLEAGWCGGQASGVNFGGVRRQGRDWREIPLATRSRQIWDQLPGLIGHDGEFVRSGHLKLARSPSDMAVLEEWAQGARDFGITVELLGQNALRDRYPEAGEVICGGSLLADDGHANPRLVAPLFAQAARAAGADIREQTRVESVVRDGSRFCLETKTGLSIEAGCLINVAGAWGCHIAAMLGEEVPEGVEAPNMLVTEPVAPIVAHSIGVVGGDIYVRQAARGNIIFGGGQARADRDTSRARPLPETSRAAMAAVQGLFPALHRLRIIRSWTGIEGFMPDGVPVVGPSIAVPGLVHGFGFCGHGFQLGPGVGAVLAELVTGGKTETEISGLSIARFLDK